MRRPLAAVAASMSLLALAPGCMRSEVAPAPASASLRDEPARGQDPRRASPEQSPEVVLDERADGARLVGRLEPVPAGTDAERVLALRLELAGRGASARATPLDGPRVLDARFVGEGLVVLGADHVLRALARPDAQPVELDRAAEAPLSVRGHEVAYVRGEMPFFEVALADVEAGSARALTEGFAPAWSPALGEDGSVVFVSSREGRPRLHRVGRDGAVQALAPSERFPTSPYAPVLEPGREGALLRFVDEQGEALLELSSGRVLEEEP